VKGYSRGCFFSIIRISSRLSKLSVISEEGHGSLSSLQFGNGSYKIQIGAFNKDRISECATLPNSSSPDNRPKRSEAFISTVNIGRIMLLILPCIFSQL